MAVAARRRATARSGPAAPSGWPPAVTQFPSDPWAGVGPARGGLRVSAGIGEAARPLRQCSNLRARDQLLQVAHPTVALGQHRRQLLSILAEIFRHFLPCK